MFPEDGRAALACLLRPHAGLTRGNCVLGCWRHRFLEIGTGGNDVAGKGRDVSRGLRTNIQNLDSGRLRSFHVVKVCRGCSQRVERMRKFHIATAHGSICCRRQ